MSFISYSPQENTESRVQKAEARALRAEMRAQRAEARIRQAEMALFEISHSRSWRWTEFFRWTVGKLRKMRRNVKVIFLKNMFKRFIKSGLRVVLNFFTGHPKFFLYANKVIPKLGLDGVVNSIYARFMPYAFNLKTSFNCLIPKEESSLSPRARQIYSELKAAIEHDRKNNS
jgi:hypothetical protein